MMSHLLSILVFVTASIIRNGVNSSNVNSWLRPPGPNRVSIDLRPPIVETNTELGHWEADTVIGKGHDGALLTLGERRTKYVLIVKLGSKQTRALVSAATKALCRSTLPVKTARVAPLAQRRLPGGNCGQRCGQIGWVQDRVI
jgi:IS30 family transposase